MDELAEQLLGGRPGPDLNAFARFVGRWSLEWTRPGDPLAPPALRGELTFGVVLGGRAVQDVWLVPSDHTPTEAELPYAFHGSTIRFFDRDLGAWRSTWVEPLQGRVRTFIGRSVGDELHLISTAQTPFLRWRFTEVSPDRFVWLGEFSVDEGRSWQLEERMVAIRPT